MKKGMSYDPISVLPPHATENFAYPFMVEFYTRLANRELEVRGELDDDLSQVEFWIRYWNKEDAALEIQPQEREPITLHLRASKGSLVAGMELYYIIKASKTPIRTICYEECTSYLLPAMVATPQNLRYAFETTLFCVPTPSMNEAHSVDALVSEEAAVSINADFEDLYYRAITDNTKILDGEIYSLDDEPWFFHGAEALERGVIGKFITDLDELSGVTHG